MYQINKTKNYKLFKKMLGNRDVSRAQIENLKRSIQEDNQLNLHPIIVNDNMEVIDGQTRLIAAEELGEEIFYIKSDTVTNHHFVLGNVNQKKLDIRDYIRFYAINQKNPEYAKINEMLKGGKLYAKNMLVLTVGKFNNDLINKLKEGKFTSKEFKINYQVLDQYRQFYDYIQMRKVRPFYMFRTAEFLKAFRWMSLTSGFDFEFFMEKIDQQWVELKPQRTVENWYKLLIKIYNFKAQNRRIDLEFINDNV